MAEDAFAKGLYCAEYVVQALTQAQDVESEMLMKMATEFCDGMSRTCGPCGALTVAVMEVSPGLGRNKADESARNANVATQ